MQHFQRFGYGWMQRQIVTCFRDVDIYIIAMSHTSLFSVGLSLILVQRHRKYTFWKQSLFEVVIMFYYDVIAVFEQGLTCV